MFSRKALNWVSLTGDETMIKVKTNNGYIPFCEQGIVTDIIDSNGNRLKTGDIVRVYDKQRRNCEPGFDFDLVSTNMVVFDQFKKFGTDSDFFICGWKSASVGGWQKTDYIIELDSTAESVDYDMYRIE